MPTIVDFAMRLHHQRSGELRLELTSEDPLPQEYLPEGCRLIGRVIEFDSLESRNKVVATAEYKRLRLSSDLDATELFDAAYELWRYEFRSPDSASGRLLAMASMEIDVLAAAAQRIHDGVSAFNVLHVVAAALPYLSDPEIRSVINLFVAQYDLTKHDLAAGEFPKELEKWLEARPGYCHALHAAALTDLTEAAASLMGNATFALSKTDVSAAISIAIDDARSTSSLRAGAGAWTLGRLLLEALAKSLPVNSIVATLTELIDGPPNDVRTEAIKAAVRVMPVNSSFDVPLLTLAKLHDQDVLCSIANALFVNRAELDARGMTAQCLKFLIELRPEFGVAIRNLDYAMSQLISNPVHVDSVLVTLSEWISKHPQEAMGESPAAKLFSATFRELIPLELIWARLLTEWLMRDGRAHASVLSRVLMTLDRRATTKMSLDKTILDGLTDEDFLFLVRRMLGYVHDRSQLTALALSMLQASDVERRIYPILRTVLIEEIGYDYPGSTVRCLLESSDLPSFELHRPFLLGIADVIKQVAETRNALPSLNELRPPTKLATLFARARAKQMSDSYEEASKDSIMRQIATRIPLKAGMGTFNYRDSIYGPSMKLSSMSHSLELPLREVFDPIGNAFRHFQFRIVKRGES